MKIKYYDAEPLLIKDIDALHDREKQNKYLKKHFDKYDYYEIVVMYKYTNQGAKYYCTNCGEDVDDDWNYCPHCGLEIEQGFTLFEDSVAKVKKQYKSVTGETMPAEEEKLIVGKYQFKVYFKED